MIGDQEVALAALGILATAVTGIIWIARYFAKELSRDLKAHTKAAVELTAASKEQKKASSEVLLFMKNLNGKLASATIQTVKEQHIGTQVVEIAHTETQTKDRRKNK